MVFTGNTAATLTVRHTHEICKTELSNATKCKRLSSDLYVECQNYHLLAMIRKIRCRQISYDCQQKY